MSKILWSLGQIHPRYGEVVAMGIKDGDPYRMFKNNKGVISLIPLDVLEYEYKELGNMEGSRLSKLYGIAYSNKKEVKHE